MSKKTSRKKTTQGTDLAYRGVIAFFAIGALIVGGRLLSTNAPDFFSSIGGWIPIVILCVLAAVIGGYSMIPSGRKSRPKS